MGVELAFRMLAVLILLLVIGNEYREIRQWWKKEKRWF